MRPVSVPTQSGTEVSRIFFKVETSAALGHILTEVLWYPGKIHDPYSSAASGYVGSVYDAVELFVAGVIVAPDDVPADHAGLFFMGGVVGAVEREVAQRGELAASGVQMRWRPAWYRPASAGPCPGSW